jgi:uncharacterized protein YbaR (Trm112 family)
MFIELTDLLRCPADHVESYLVLLPDVVEDRSVKSGQLGCPVCNRTFKVVNGVFDAGGAPPPIDSAPSALSAEAITVLTGLSGPGGYLALVGPVASLWREVAQLNPGVALVSINPGREVEDAPRFSIIRGGTIPIKSNALRAIVLGKPYAENPGWLREAARVVLPGLRIVGEGPDPPPSLIDLSATSNGIWVGVKRR